MKILHSIGFYDNRYFFREKYYTQELAKLGHDVYLLSSTSGLTQDVNSVDFSEGKELRDSVTVIRKRKIWKIKDMIFFDFKKDVLEIRPSIVHLYEARQYVTYRIAKFCVKHSIPFVYEHEQRSLGESFLGKARSKIFVNRWVKYCAEHASLVRSLTPGAKDFILETGASVDPNKNFLGTLAFDKSKAHLSKDARRKFREKYGYSENELILGFSGKFDWSKKPELVVRAFEKAIIYKNLKLFIVYSGEEEFTRKFRAICESSPADINLIEGLFKNEEYNSFLNGVDYLIWTKPTISFFEALGTGARIIVPYGDGTRHLASKNIEFFGQSGGIEMRTTRINDESKIETELMKIFSQLGSYCREDDDELKKFSADQIVKNLERQYYQSLDNTVV